MIRDVDLENLRQVYHYQNVNIGLFKSLQSNGFLIQ